MVAALAALLVVAAGYGVRAQEAAPGAKHSDDPAAVEARHHYEEGTKAFNLGEFPRAVAEFKAAYNAKSDPLLLYNIAQSFRLQGDAVQAIFFYKSFLRNMPNTPNRKEVEGRIRALEKQLEEQKKEAAVLPPAAAPAVTAPTVTPPPETTVPPQAAPAVPAPAPAVAEAPPAPVVSADEDHARPTDKSLPMAANPALSAAPAAPSVDLTRPAEPAPSTPIYKKWWFWTGVGVVATAGVLAAVAAARDKPPSTTYGLLDPKWMTP